MFSCFKSCASSLEKMNVFEDLASKVEKMSSPRGTLQKSLSCKQLHAALKPLIPTLNLGDVSKKNILQPVSEIRQTPSSHRNRALSPAPSSDIAVVRRSDGYNVNATPRADSHRALAAVRRKKEKKIPLDPLSCRVTVMGTGGSIFVSGLFLASASFSVTFTHYDDDRIEPFNDRAWNAIEDCHISPLLAAYCRWTFNEDVGDIYGSAAPGLCLKYADVIFVECIYPFDECALLNLQDLRKSWSMGQLIVLECWNNPEATISNYLTALEKCGLDMDSIFVVSILHEDPFIKKPEYHVGKMWKDYNCWRHSKECKKARKIVQHVMKEKMSKRKGHSKRAKEAEKIFDRLIEVSASNL